MAQMVVIDARSKTVLLEHSASSRTIAEVLGAGPRTAYALPNDDQLKVNGNSVEQACFTIGRSNRFRGNAVVIVKTSVNVSNMEFLVAAIRQMVNFEADNYMFDERSSNPIEQMELWPRLPTDDGEIESAGGS
jgi:hypothetical protein